MYPLNMTLKIGIGFAVANNEAEHKSLNDAGYWPAFEESNVTDIDAIRAVLDARGISYDKRLGIEKLRQLI